MMMKKVLWQSSYHIPGIQTMQKHSSLLYRSIGNKLTKFYDKSHHDCKPCRNTLAYCDGASMMKKKVLWHRDCNIPRLQTMQKHSNLLGQSANYKIPGIQTIQKCSSLLCRSIDDKEKSFLAVPPPQQQNKVQRWRHWNCKPNISSLL
jgi:hypothetical protein